MKPWQFWIDRGGTFTDIVAKRGDGSLVTAKLLSECPEQYDDAAVAGIKRLLGLGPKDAIDAARVEAVKMGTTVATNALLERKGEPLLLVVTRGFKDALRIAYQNRPRLFDRHISLPEMLYSDVVEVNERMSSDGEILQPLDEAEAREVFRKGYERGLRATAIVLLHGYCHTGHEARLAQIARESGFTQVSVSHEISPLVRFVPRGDTTVVDGYLSPILRRYVNRVAGAMPGVRLQFMQSNGGLTDALSFQGKDSVLSGPAGGIVAMARVSGAAGFNEVIGFDMGGTSTDVSHYAGEFERDFETQVAGVRMRAPMMSIHTVAAGGGSVLHFDGARLRVGPDSAGANPGPACYRRGGPLTVTDANVMLGKLQPSFFPAVFGPEGNSPLDVDAVRKRFVELAERVASETGKRMAPEELAQGFIDVAVANMANAIKRISVQRGYDVTTYTLATFGGAGGQHACLVADALAMPRILAHPFAGVLSAYGMGLAEQIAMRERSVELPLQLDGYLECAEILRELDSAARDELLAQGASREGIRVSRLVTLRYQGTDTAISVNWGPINLLVDEFARKYKQRFAFLMPDRPLVIESAIVEAASAADQMDHAATRLQSPAMEYCAPPQPQACVRMFTAGSWRDTPVYKHESLLPGATVNGPAILVESTGTTIVEPGWRACITQRNDLVISRYQSRPQKVAIGTEVNPVKLEIFNNLFMSIAEQMGYRLQNTAHSVTIKERLDFSCAVFDASGRLVANAPHMPVHLGSMGASVNAIIQNHLASPARAPAGQPLKPGDVYILNDPYAGGTHLPDITVITPVFDQAGAHILFYVGSRGHHADIGGITPGSMPADSRVIEEEGTLLTDFLLVQDGVFREQALRDELAAAKWPARNPDQTIADLRAQIAANEKGREELLKMVSHFGLDVVAAYMRHVQANAEESVRRVIGALKDGEFELPLDNGAVLRVRIIVDRRSRSAVIDFTGTSPQQPNNFNAPRAVTMAAVLYVFRTLVDDDIPMNEGCLTPLDVIVPEGSMLNPDYPAAVVAGNVETSMCVTNCLYGALGIMASGAPTMSNFTFGNERHQYYETISGGSGAGGNFDAAGGLVGGFHGTSVVQTHMTNSRLTDPEVLENRFPVRLESYEIRHGSGGAGRWRGGDGAIRKIRFLESMTASILSNGRIHPAFGILGGAAAATGRNSVIRADGSVEILSHADKAEMEPGDMFVIETPGGGGCGAADDT
ncbi:MAG: hydantoinase B/oxoprolinase family protein [Burkholderiaceae bacterium]